MINPPDLLKRNELGDVFQDLVEGGRILAHRKIVDAFGHISARHPSQPERFLLSRRIAPGLARAEDIREFGMDAELIDNDGAPAFLERFIHSAVYAARPTSAPSFIAILPQL